jgi:hypothetical protein
MFVQAYYALRQQVGETGWQALKVEAVDFENRTLQRCGVPAAGLLPPDPGPWVACLTAAYERQRTVWLSRLSGQAAEEARRPIERHVALQRDLQSLGFLPPTANIDGVYGAATRAAILAWQSARGMPATGFLGDQDEATLDSQVSNSMPATPSPPQSQPSDAHADSPTAARAARVPTCGDLVQAHFEAKAYLDQGAGAKYEQIMNYVTGLVMQADPADAGNMGFEESFGENLGNWCAGGPGRMSTTLNLVVPSVISAMRQGQADSPMESHPPDAHADNPNNPEVVVLALTCTPTSVGPEIQGEIKNLSSQPIGNAEIKPTFRDTNGGFVSTADALVSFNPLLPGQTSPFDGYGGMNPAIAKVTIAPSILFGRALTFSGISSAFCPPR